MFISTAICIKTFIGTVKVGIKYECKPKAYNNAHPTMTYQPKHDRLEGGRDGITMYRGRGCNNRRMKRGYSNRPSERRRGYG